MSKPFLLQPAPAEARAHGEISVMTTPDPRDVRTTAILIRDYGVMRRDYTAGAERILRNAQFAARFFNEPEVTEVRIALAVLLDREGAKALAKRGVVGQPTFTACMASLQRMRAPSEGPEVKLLPYSTGAQELLDKAKGRAGEREADIALVAVEDLVHVLLGEVKEGRLTTVVKVEAKPRRGLFGLVMLGIAGLAVAGIAGLLYANGLVDWNWPAAPQWMPTMRGLASL